jgi:transcriptional regulator with GAF, ATPase, and Fis domain
MPEHMTPPLEAVITAHDPCEAAATIMPRYDALIRVSQALRAYHDRDTLFRSLARELRSVVGFSFLSIGLYDERTHTVESSVLEVSGEPIAPPRLSADESLTYFVIRQQKPLLIPDVELETRFPKATAYLRQQHMRSTCSLPLTTRQRKIGMLLAASQEPDSFGSEDVAFLSLVANQVALAIDDAMNYGELQDALALERERQRNLDASDELLRALFTVLDIRQVFPRVSAIAATVVPHDLLTFTFHDRGGEVILQAASADWDPLPARLKLAPSASFDEGFSIVNDLKPEKCPVVEPPGFWERVHSAGYRSCLDVRLTARHQLLGLQFWSKQPGAFESHHVPVARRVADHVALAVSHEQLVEMARRATEATVRAERLEARVKSLSDELAMKTGHGRMVGASGEWQAVLKAATQVAATDATVMLAGESGTGKEVVARFIHAASTRSGGPFVALNCAALPEQLLESELFGYERGAFTGAQQSKPGQIELAAGGVLFLDEVSEMSPSAQAKFLRVLQEREFQRLGGTRTLKANVRVIAATNRDLGKAMERGDFREDLFYRLQVFDIKLPPLRERPKDILPLSESFLQEIGHLVGRPPAGLTRDAKDALLRYHWPGNVRELRNALERAAILCEGGLITAEHLSMRVESRSASPPVTPKAGAITDLNAVERDLIAQVLAECAGNKSKAAARLGITRTQLYVRLRRYQLA